jgi:hypothetical protein
MRASAVISKFDLDRSFKRKKRIIKRKNSKHANISRQLKQHHLDIPIKDVCQKLVIKKPQTKRKGSNVYIPQVFSLLEDPAAAFSTIYEIVNKASNRKCNQLYIDYSRCKSYSLGSESLLGIIARTIKYQKKIRGTNVSFNGRYPVDDSHLEIVRDVGIVKEIEADNDRRESADTLEQFLFIQNRSSESKGSAYAMDDKNNTAEAFVKYIDKCLIRATSKKELKKASTLTENASRVLKSCIGELLDNSERHALSTGQGKWHMRAHVNFAHEHPSCEIVIFNFGKTIAETFDGLADEHFSLHTQVKPYVKSHIHNKHLTEENLTVVAALQGRVSCKNIDMRNTCGTGTIELLEFFQNLSDAIGCLNSTSDEFQRPDMSLISGSTWIKFDGKYKLKHPHDDEMESEEYYENREQLVYPLNNELNGLKSPPDPKYVKTIKNGFFPGFMLNIRFSLDLQ